jgi:hypothetical protein
MRDLGGAPMGFDDTLAFLLDMIGRRVAVAVAASAGDPPMVIQLVGVLDRARDLGDMNPYASESVEFRFRDDPSSLFVIHREAFCGAEAGTDWLLVHLHQLHLAVRDAEHEPAEIEYGWL